MCSDVPRGDPRDFVQVEQESIGHDRSEAENGSLEGEEKIWTQGEGVRCCPCRHRFDELHMIRSVLIEERGKRIGRKAESAYLLILPKTKSYDVHYRNDPDARGVVTVAYVMGQTMICGSAYTKESVPKNVPSRVSADLQSGIHAQMTHRFS